MRLGALALNDGLDQAEFVDATLDDLDRLIDRLANALGERRLGRGQRNQAAASRRYRHCAGPVDAKNAGERLRKLAQLAAARFRHRCRG